MLVEDVKRDGLDYGMYERTRAAWAWFKEWVPAPARVRVVGDDDSDGVTSAFVVGTALRRAGYDVDLKIMAVHTPADVDIALHDARDAYVVLDAGSALIEAIDSHRVPCLILDHHRVNDFTPQNTFEVNPRRDGGDRVEHVSTSVLAALFAVEVGDHWDLAYAGIAGGISDRQHLGGFKGLIGYVAQGASRHGVIASSLGLTLSGATTLEAVADSLDPYFEAYSGKPDAVRELLARHRIAPTDSPLALGSDAAAALARELTQSLRSLGVVTERMYPLYDERFPITKNMGGVTTVFALAQLLEAATATRAHALALRVLSGDADAVREARILHKRRVTSALSELARLRTVVGERPHLRWAETQDPANTGVYAHTLLTFVHGDDKPFLIIARTGSEAKSSTRGSRRLYLAGLDLSIAVHEAANAVGGHGGGHPGAAGATFPYERRLEFIDFLEAALARLQAKGAP